MMTERTLSTSGWDSYELLDSGDGMKLERFGEIILERPEIQALWAKKNPSLWKKAHATFVSGDKGEKGSWKMEQEVPESWPMQWNGLSFLARFAGFKHTGVFPEQEPNWVWIQERINKLSEPKVLNLFGYTGIASLAAASARAVVTHVDASKQSLDFAHENADASKIAKDRIRWVADDALAFARREVRRGIRYDGIILDPPAFGRGGKGQVWNIDEDLPKLLSALADLLSKKPGAFFLLNGYAAGYTSLTFAQAIESAFGKVTGESGELRIMESGTGRAISSGIFARFVRE